MADRLHIIMRAGYLCFYFLATILIAFINSENKKKIYTHIVSVVLLIAAASNIYIANKEYLLMDYTYRETYSYFTVLTAQIRMTEGYTENTKVYLVGKTDIASEVSDQRVFSQPDLANAEYKNNMLRYYTASDFNLASNEETEEYIANHDLSNMPIYPNDGSIQYINGDIVVNLGNKSVNTDNE